MTRGDVKAEDREELEKTGDYIVDEKHKTVDAHRDRDGEGREDAGPPSRAGTDGLYDPQNMKVLHHVNQALRAHALYKRDVEYVVKDGEVVIVDEFTGRLMPGRRWSDGLHQAVEAKEESDHPEVKIERENQTLATITFQNYFRMYKKLAGMTGTADTEAAGIRQDLQARRHGHPDQPRAEAHRRARTVVYRTEKEKFDAVVDEIIEKQQAGPAGPGRHGLDREVGAAVEAPEARGIKHVVLNAKYHEQEAEIVAQAGRKGAVTIATNMAGRGTDILLGGNPEFMARQQALADQIVERLPKGQEKFVDDADFVYFYHLDSFYRVRAPSTSASSPPTRSRPTSSTTRSSRWAACTSSAPSATRRGASTTSFAAAPAARAIPARRASTCRSKTT